MIGYEKYTGNWPDWVELTGEIIAENARQCAWPLGTKKAKYHYPDGKKYGKYKEMLDKAFPNRKKYWGTQTAAGASCDVFASTMVKSTGYDKKIPRGLDEQFKHFAQSPLWKKVDGRKKKNRKPGDYGLWSRGSYGHAWINLGKKTIAEAGYHSKAFGHIEKAHNKRKSSYDKLLFYRPTKPLRTYVKLGDRGKQVKRAQLFLNWAGFLQLEANGIFDEVTKQAVIDFRKSVGLEESGRFDEKCVEKGQELIKEINNKYEGQLPTKTLKVGSKRKKQIRLLQTFLNWYGGYDLTRDGSFGPLTKKALLDFQEKENIAITGIVDEATLDKMKRFL